MWNLSHYSCGQIHRYKSLTRFSIYPKGFDLWGEAWIFAITAFLAMLFDAQFILIQRFNRPRVLRILEKQKNLQKRVTETAPLLS